ncbi:hypothetical protein [Halobacterium sp. CBA1126]|uniref:hypothetical protein n=1 Tax=Halobacterium sp. CBA1126 TaxID=2668074 RepID=UPI0012FA7DC7|nr:hypothetical protein [Halobacterium sp. CBA1126]
MLARNPHVVYDSIPYDETEALRPLEALPAAAVVTHDEAVARLEDASDDEILAIEPVSMATGYHLGQTPLTTITIDELPTETISQLAATTARDITAYRYIVLGNQSHHENRTLREYEAV